MAILDAALKLSEAQAVTATAFSANTIDLTVARDIGVGYPNLYMVWTCDTTAASGGTSTVTFEIVVSDNANLSSPTVIAASGAIDKAALVAGYRYELRIPNQPGSIGKRYLGARYTVGTTNLTAGAFSCEIAESTTDQKAYPIGYSITV